MKWECFFFANILFFFLHLFHKPQKMDSGEEMEEKHSGVCNSRTDLNSWQAVHNCKLLDTMRSEYNRNIRACPFESHEHPGEDCMFIKVPVSQPELLIRYLNSFQYSLHVDLEMCTIGIDFRTWKSFADYLIAPLGMFTELQTQLFGHAQRRFNLMSLFSMWCAFGINTKKEEKCFMITRWFSKEPRFLEYCIEHNIANRVFHVIPFSVQIAETRAETRAEVEETGEIKKTKNDWAVIEFVPRSIWQIMQDTSNVYIAGGACIPTRPNLLTFLPSSDIDLYVLDTNYNIKTEEKSRGLDELLCKIIQTLRKEGYIICHQEGKSVQAIAPPGMRNFQIMLSNCTSIQKLLYTFDLHVCQFATNGKNVLHSLKAMQDLDNGIISHQPLIPARPERIIKYKMKGFQLDEELASWLTRKSATNESKVIESLMYSYAMQFKELPMAANMWQLRRQNLLISVTPEDDLELDFEVGYKGDEPSCKKSPKKRPFS